MDHKILVKLEHATAACQDKNGNQIAIPLLGKIQVIDGKVYCYIEGYLDQFGNEVDEETIEKILENLHYQNN
ncbi:hypothetical protein MTP04_02170 [Lysinibacillus sp. PLM2]|nr:hypothetical protein MTP04_02170 [Lysinibacillus sp. PLM2]